MGRVRGLAAGLAAGAMGLLAAGAAAAQADGYVYLQCDFPAASSGQGAISDQLKIGRGDWFSMNAEKGAWGSSLCRTDFSANYRGQCLFTETKFELVATAGSIKQTTTISRTDGTIVRHSAEGHVEGACKAIPPPPARPRQS
ncbi:MAG TPA: hypothetical protein VGO52_09965 [Hyphomonadaceae bacterium]|jgi:hypothetical protein|nr:hypothetical protein [Hyphomonadaceae bacterium]